ncbi:MAG TPA: NAD(+) synthase, partial [Cyclobacteriaceae bacterium]|nr:NAD(+) synthase [Cyclobacteriaceae bacterium]
PELCISGYILTDMWVNESFCLNLMRYNNILLQASVGIAIAYGNIYLDKDINKRWKDNRHHPNKDGRTRKYNAVYVMQDGRFAKRINESSVLPEGIQPKTLLPNYRIFDDERYFFSLEDVAKDAGMTLEEVLQPFMVKTKRGEVAVGFEVCEDLWCEDYRRDGRPINITKVLIEKGAGIIVNVSASPWNHGKNASRDNRIRFLKKESADSFVPFIYVNKTGVQNNGKNFITFDGGTTVYNREGEPVLMAYKSYQEELIIFEDSVFNGKPLKRDEAAPIRQKFDAIVQGIKHLRLFKSDELPLRFVLGLSGGIDSAVVASLLAMACGKENVLAVNMPSQYNIEKTKQTATTIAGNLGVDYLVIPIDEMNAVSKNLFSRLDEKYGPSIFQQQLSDENIQAKIRGTSILSNIAGRYNHFMTNNGNKLEIALGYTTLYGDVNGAIAPIGDLTKTEIYQMARLLNEEIFREKVIPDHLFPDELFRFSEEKIIPSPELKHDQINPMRFGYHCALLTVLTDYIRKTPEEILQWYLDGILHKNLDITIDLIHRWQINNAATFIEDLEWFVSTIQKNIFKRIQMPPIVITSKSAYGYDIRESMLPYETNILYKELKEKVLKMKTYKPI